MLSKINLRDVNISLVVTLVDIPRFLDYRVNTAQRTHIRCSGGGGREIICSASKLSACNLRHAKVKCAFPLEMIY